MKSRSLNRRRNIVLVLGCAALLLACGKPTSRAPNPIAHGWQDAPLLASDNEWGAFDHDMSQDALGNALAVWEQFDGTRYNIWANRKVAGAGWGSATQIAPGKVNAYNPQIGQNTQGELVAQWQQPQGALNFNGANRYVAGVGWGAATLVADNYNSQY